METETLSQIVRRLSKAIEQDPNHAELYYERGMAYFKHENWQNAEDDFLQAIAHNKDYSRYKTYYYWRASTYEHLRKWNEAADDYSRVMGLDPGETVKHGDYCLAIGEMRGDILPYLEDRGYAYFHAGEFEKALDDFKATAWYTETLTPGFIAALATLEQYDLLEKLVKELGTTALNERVPGNFAYWEPTPLYFITGKNQRTKMEDVCKMVRFLVSKGADVNMAAGDGSTPLWNQAIPNGSLEILQTLLELGGNPNQISVDGGHEWAPLANCLMPNPVENDENSWLPFDALAIKKAKLLLEYGADPNLANPFLPDYPPLVLAISYGFPQTRQKELPSSEVVALIEWLLKQGANPNFSDRDGNTPLSLAIEKNLLEVGQLLLLYGATETKTNKKQTNAEIESEDDAGLHAKIALRWEQMCEKYERKPDLTGNNPVVAMLDRLNGESGAMVARPASAEDLVFCDTDLIALDFPELPGEYIDFLKICGGLAFDSMELYGTDIVTDSETDFQLIDIVTATEDFNDYYVDGGSLDDPLLCFGRWNGDYFTYDPQTAKYQVRSHECISDIWNEYDTFEEFFRKEVRH